MAYVPIAEHFGKKDDMKKRSVREMRHIAGLTLKTCKIFGIPCRFERRDETLKTYKTCKISSMKPVKEHPAKIRGVFFYLIS